MRHDTLVMHDFASEAMEYYFRMESSLTDNCKIVRDCVVGHELILNAEKTYLLTVGTSASLRIQDSTLKVSIDEVQLKDSVDQSTVGNRFT